MVTDPFCAIHGKRWSEHAEGRCLYCCLCFKPLTVEECHLLPGGLREDVCEPCALLESLAVRAIQPQQQPTQPA